MDVPLLNSETAVTWFCVIHGTVTRCPFNAMSCTVPTSNEPFSLGGIRWLHLNADKVKAYNEGRSVNAHVAYNEHNKEANT